MNDKEQAIIPMSEYRRLKEIDKLKEEIRIITDINPWTSLSATYFGKDESIKILTAKLHTALTLIEKIENAGLFGRIFFKGFKKEYNR